MDFHDYVRAVRRSIALIVIATLLGGAVAVAYLLVAPRKWDATSTLLIAANVPTDISDAKTGADLAQGSVGTAAALVDSPVVLLGAVDDLGGAYTVQQLGAIVTATAGSGGGVLVVQATASSAEAAQTIADAVAQRAARTLPTVIGGIDDRGASILRADVIQPAALPSVATSPNRNGVLGIGILAGLCAGVAFAIVRFTLDTRVRDREDLRATGVPLVGAIPRRTRRDAGLLLVRDQPLGASGEAYRAMRTNVLSVLPDRAATVMLAPVGSPHDIAAVAVGLAWSCAEALRRTIVVDLDIRHPGVEHILGLAPAPGAAEVLSDVIDLDRAIRDTSNERLRVLGAGATTGSPTDLLASSQLGKLLAELLTRFDVVVLRAPALSMYTDASIIARSTDATALVVRAGRDREAEVQGAIGAVTTVSAAPVGVVLDGVRPSLGRRFFRREPARAARAQTAFDDLLVLDEEPDILAPADAGERLRGSRGTGVDDGA